jgi:light-regulated signal transduction histidine kinase (bacteriophytochrome)
VDDLLAFSRVANVESVPRASIEFALVVRWARNNLAVSIEESGASITCGDLPVVWGNQVQLVQVIQNVLANAIRYRKPGTTPDVHISAALHDAEWVFYISDKGIGISPEYHEQVFGLFRRLHRDATGTGIGLAICKKIIEKHAGRIWIESTLGEGTTIVFTLPKPPDADARL